MLGQFLGRQQARTTCARFRAAMNVSAEMIWLVDPVRMAYRRERHGLPQARLHEGELLKKGRRTSSKYARRAGAKYRLIAAGRAHGESMPCKTGPQVPGESFRRALTSGAASHHHGVRDVTERRAAEEDLRRFRLAMDSSPT